MSGGLKFKHSYRYSMLAGLLLASIFFATNVYSEPKAGGQSVYIPNTTVMQQFLQKTNDLRKQNDLPPLAASEQLEKSAIEKLNDMNTDVYWGHYAPDGTSFSTFIWDEKSDASYVGENLARCFNGYDAAFNGLVNSPKHYAVLTGNFSYIGVASEITTNGCESIVMHVSN